jgi:hypothetical protein
MAIETRRARSILIRRTNSHPRPDIRALGIAIIDGPWWDDDPRWDLPVALYERLCTSHVDTSTRAAQIGAYLCARYAQRWIYDVGVDACLGALEAHLCDVEDVDLAAAVDAAAAARAAARAAVRTAEDEAVWAAASASAAEVAWAAASASAAAEEGATWSVEVQAERAAAGAAAASAAAARSDPSQRAALRADLISLLCALCEVQSSTSPHHLPRRQPQPGPSAGLGGPPETRPRPRVPGLKMYVRPEDQGQIVEVSYGYAYDQYAYCCTYDRSDGSESWQHGLIDWDREPEDTGHDHIPCVVQWLPCAAPLVVGWG